jgi:4a-hydroxytetrahydrobiopterin dehydratase
MEPFRPNAESYTTFSAEVVTRPQGMLPDTAVLTDTQAESLRQAQAPNWHLAEGRLTRTFRFTQVSDSQAFTHRVQGLSHSRQQHPHIFVDFKAVHIELWTQTKGGLTRHDFDLAELIDQALDMP